MSTERAYCAYCLEAYEREVTAWGTPNQTCGKELCVRRTASWNNWITTSQATSILGDVNKPPKRSLLPPRMTDKYALLAELTFGVKSEAEVAA